ncbi:MAG: FkbM family methyltransferase [Brevefilum sp.]|nr:FkbM family methyltransferase [Brevefilum sp.]MDT8380942.1 FkbM family methyltransferase [Brevefilum sp.]MDW7754391.1 FkbM family methyltransferase [Brevefilum sp.]
MNFSKIHYQSFIGRLLRFPLRLIPKNTVMPILQGALRGKKWVVGSGEHGYWLGSYEMNKRLAFENTVKPGSVVYDIGANVGYFTLLAAVLVEEKGKVFSFEPLPRNINFLRQHISLNKLTNIRVIEAAVSDHMGQALFDLGASTAMGHLSETGGLHVQMVSLDQMIENGDLDTPGVLKIDVEGAEHDVLCGAENLIESARPILFLDTHQREAHQKTLEFLQSHNYQVDILDGKSIQETREFIARPKKS